MGQDIHQGYISSVSERNHGIDLLRIVSMFMVLLLHILGHGGVLKATAPGTPQNTAAWTLETLAYCAVNCYALISGYVGIRGKYKYSNFALIWLQTVFYTLIITTLFFAFSDVPLVKGSFTRALLPVKSSSYWYLTAYACMFFFIPALNTLVNSLQKKQAFAIVITVIVLFTVLSTFAKSELLSFKVNDLFVTSGGYSPLWLCLLYIIGAFISKYQDSFKIKPIICFALYFLLSVITLLEKLFVKKSVLINYTSPTVLFCAILLLIGFSQLKCKFGKKIISFFAPLSFSVYLIHENSLVRNEFITERFSKLASFSALKLIICVVFAAAVIYIVCSAIDLIRHYLFKGLKLKARLSKLEDRLTHGLWK